MVCLLIQVCGNTHETKGCGAVAVAELWRVEQPYPRGLMLSWTQLLFELGTGRC